MTSLGDRETRADQNPKVTDPSAAEIREGAGAVASDSLAAESSRADGGFSENRNGEPLGVSGANSVFANENTSAATRLHPASDAEARMAQEDWAEEKKLGAAATTYQTQSPSNGGSSAGTAPSYVNSQFQDRSGPKGENLTEGGFDSYGAKNASFDSEIGSRDDPGRLAEQKFQRDNADAAESAGFPKQQGSTGENAFEALDRNTAA